MHWLKSARLKSGKAGGGRREAKLCLDVPSSYICGLGSNSLIFGCSESMGILMGMVFASNPIPDAPSFLPTSTLLLSPSLALRLLRQPQHRWQQSMGSQ